MTESKKTESPAKIEATGVDTVTFNVEVNGRKFNLEAPADIMSADPDAYIAYEERKFGVMLKMILGESQWMQLRGAGITTRQLIEDVFTAYQEAAGLGED